MKYKHTGGEPLTACAIGACSAAAPVVSSITAPVLADVGLGSGIALSKYKRKKSSKKKKSPKKKKSSKKKKSLKRGGKCKKSLKRGGKCKKSLKRGGKCKKLLKKKKSLKRGGVCPNCYDQECDECKIKSEEEERENNRKWVKKKKDMRKECSELIKLLEKNKSFSEEDAEEMNEKKENCVYNINIDDCNYCKNKLEGIQRGGNINNIIFILLLFYFMYKQSVNKDFYDIKDIDVGYSDDLILPEEVGLSLIPYTQEVSDAIINYVIGGDFENQAHTLSLDDSGNIKDIKLYFNPYLKELLDFTSKDYERQKYVETYKNRDLGLQHNDRWFDTKIRDYNLPQEGDISKILEACLPGIHLLTGKIPKKLFMSGTFAKNVNIFNPQWHQDYPGTNRLYPNVADYNIRLMLIPQKDYETKYPELINFSKDTKLTDYATQVDNYKPENRLHPDKIGYTGGPFFDYFKTNIAQKVNLKIDQTKYVGIMFNNYKLFHKSPDVDGFLRSTQRDIIQLQFIFNDKDLITPATDIKQDLGEFNNDIIENIEDKLHKKNDANIEEIFGGMFRN